MILYDKKSFCHEFDRQMSNLQNAMGFTCRALLNIIDAMNIRHIHSIVYKHSG